MVQRSALPETAMHLLSLAASSTTRDVDPQFPSSLAITTGDAVHIGAGDSAFGYSRTGGRVVLDGRGIVLPLDSFFSFPGPAILEGGEAVMGIRHGFHALTLFGLLERSGRLPYIDGCSVPC